MIKDWISLSRYVYLDDFISPDTCVWALASLRTANWQPGVITYADGRTARMDTRICSQVMEVDFPDEIRHLVNESRERVCELLEVPRPHCERALVVKYGPGGRFDVHSDCGLYPDNERHYTIVLTLQSPIAGGETAFVKLPAEVSSQAGRCLIWSNLDGDGNPDPAMDHAGRPVILGEKYIIVFWLRKHPY